MHVVLIIISLGFLGLIIYYAVSNKYSRLLRLVALGALGLICISLGVASIFIALNGTEDESAEPHLPIFLGVPREPTERNNAAEIVVFLVIFSAILGLIAVIASRDRKKRLEEAKRIGPSTPFPLDEHPVDLEMKADEAPPKSKDDDPFNLDLG